ncbi:MAG: hypothetical protein WD595_05745 [Waddliaceae bacterium]
MQVNTHNITDRQIAFNTVLSIASSIPLIGRTFAWIKVTTGVTQIINALAKLMLQRKLDDHFVDQLMWGVKNVTLGLIETIPIIGNIVALASAILYWACLYERIENESRLEVAEEYKI